MARHVDIQCVPEQTAIEPVHEISNNVVCATSKASDQPAQRRSLEYTIIVKLLTEHHLEFLSLKGGCRGSSESTHVKIPHCVKSHALVQLIAVEEAHTVIQW